MSLDDYKVVLYRNQPDGWVAEIPSIHGCYALMPTREEALAWLLAWQSDPLPMIVTRHVRMSYLFHDFLTPLLA